MDWLEILPREIPIDYICEVCQKFIERKDGKSFVRPFTFRALESWLTRVSRDTNLLVWGDFISGKLFRSSLCNAKFRPFSGRLVLGLLRIANLKILLLRISVAFSTLRKFVGSVHELVCKLMSNASLQKTKLGKRILKCRRKIDVLQKSIYLILKREEVVHLCGELPW